MLERHKISVNSFELMCFRLGIDKEKHIQNIKKEEFENFKNQTDSTEIIEYIKRINNVDDYIEYIYKIYDYLLVSTLNLIYQHFEFWEKQLDFDLICLRANSTNRKEALLKYLSNIELVIKFDNEFNISVFQDSNIEKKTIMVMDDNILLVYKYFNPFIADALYKYENENLINHKTEDEVILYAENPINFDYAFYLLKLISNSGKLFKQNFNLDVPSLNLFSDIVQEITDLTLKFTFLHEMAHLISKEEHKVTSIFEKEFIADHFALYGLLLNSSEYGNVKSRTIIGIVTAIFIIGYKNALSEKDSKIYPSPNERLKYALYHMSVDDKYSESLMKEIINKFNILFKKPIQKLKLQNEYKS